MSDIAERLVSWAQNEEMIDEHFLQHGLDCMEAAEEIERLRAKLKLSATARALLAEHALVIERAKIKAALALHTPLEPYGDEPYQRCCSDPLAWPCPTVKALRGGDDAESRSDYSTPSPRKSPEDILLEQHPNCNCLWGGDDAE